MENEITDEPKLWAMHVPGPDDVFAMESEAAARDAVAEHNKAVAEMGLAERFGMTPEQVSARVIEWPHSAESHAESVGVSIFKEQNMNDTKDSVADALQPVAWIRKNGIRFNAEAEPQDDSETALYSQTAIDTLRAQLAEAQRNALGSHDVREPTSIGCAVNRAARDLPEGWEIRIDLERGAGAVFLIDPDGNETMSEGGELFSDQINAAIDAAMGEQS